MKTKMFVRKHTTQDAEVVELWRKSFIVTMDVKYGAGLPYRLTEQPGTIDPWLSNRVKT